MRGWLNIIVVFILLLGFILKPLPIKQSFGRRVYVGETKFNVRKYQVDHHDFNVYFSEKDDKERIVEWNDQKLYIRDAVEFYPPNENGDWIMRCVNLSKDFGMDFKHAMYALKGGSKMYFYPDGSLALFELAHPSEWEYDKTLLPLKAGTHVELYENGLLKEAFIRQNTLYYTGRENYTFSLLEGGRIAYYENGVPRMLSIQDISKYPLGEEEVLWKPHENERHMFYDEGDIGFHKNWNIAWGYPAHLLTFQIQDKPLFIKSGERTFFFDSGFIRYGILNNGFDYETKYGILPLEKNKPVAFYENGQLARGILSKTTKVDEFVYPRGFELRFAENGELIR
jgi:hypothetical protein